MKFIFTAFIVFMFFAMPALFYIYVSYKGFNKIIKYNFGKTIGFGLFCGISGIIINYLIRLG